jgi:hypothetical protein
MKNLDARIRAGGDDAVAAACEMAGLADERRCYEETMKATSDITDIVTVLRSVGFAAISPQAGDSASLLHYCVTHAADEIVRLREAIRRLADQDATLLVQGGSVTVTMDGTITDEERAAIAWFSRLAYGEGGRVPDYAATLRKLLERTA